VVAAREASRSEASRFQELLKQSRAGDKEDRERAELFSGMIVSPGWKMYSELLTKLIEMRGSELLSPCSGVDATYGQEHMKGTMNGLILARDLPATIVEHMKALRSQGGERGESDDG
jgi:hypothetical protein